MRFGTALAALSCFVAVPAHAGTVTVHIFNFDFGTAPPVHSDPLIETGDTVQWVWDSGVHSTTSAAGQAESWNSGLKNSGTFDKTFTAPGSYGYYCSLHGLDLGGGMVSGMSGRVFVANTFFPTTAQLVRGLLVSGSVADVSTSDDVYLTVKRGPTANGSEAPIQVVFTTTSTVLNPQVLAVKLEDGVNTTGLTRKTEFFNYQTGLFEIVDQSAASTTDKVNLFVVTGTPSRFVESQTGQVKVKTSYFATGPVSVAAYRARFDRVAVLAL